MTLTLHAPLPPFVITNHGEYR